MEEYVNEDDDLITGDEDQEIPNDPDSFNQFLNDLDDMDEESAFSLSLLSDDYLDDDEEEYVTQSQRRDYDFQLSIVHPNDNEENQQLSDFRNMFVPTLKSKGVNYEGVNQRLKQYINDLPDDLKDLVVVTSGADGTHSKNSKHQSGSAIDLRYNPKLHSYIEQTANKSGLRTINPNHGTAPHTHLEIMQLGGYNVGDMSDPFARMLTQSISQGISNTGTNTDWMGGLSSIAGSASSLMGGLQKLDELKKKKNQLLFNTTNSAIDSAISVLGERNQNEEIRRLQQLRAEQSMNYAPVNPPIKNIPAYT